MQQRAFAKKGKKNKYGGIELNNEEQVAEEGVVEEKVVEEPIVEEPIVAEPVVAEPVKKAAKTEFKGATEK